MLLSCLQRHAQGTIIFCVNTHPDNATRYGSLEIIFCGKESSMRATITKRNAKTLGRSNGYISAKLAWRCKQGQCKKICCHSNITASVVNDIYKITKIFYCPKIIWILNNRTKKCIVDISSLIIAKNNFNSKWCRSCYDHIFRLRKNFIINKKLFGFYFISFVHVMKKHTHRLCC